MDAPLLTDSRRGGLADQCEPSGPAEDTPALRGKITLKTSEADQSVSDRLPAHGRFALADRVEHARLLLGFQRQHRVRIAANCGHQPAKLETEAVGAHPGREDCRLIVIRLSFELADQR